MTTTNTTQATLKSYYTKYVPLVAPVVLVVLQLLVNNGVWHLSAHVLSIVDVVTAALGLHSLHLRTK
jgi:hypothetical protein